MDVLEEVINDCKLLAAIHSYQPLDWYVQNMAHTFGKKWVFLAKKENILIGMVNSTHSMIMRLPDQQ